MSRIIQTTGSVEVQSPLAMNTGGTVGTFAAADTTPSVASGNLWKSGGSVTITTFDDATIG